MQVPTLSPRLQAIAEHILPCHTMADIGTDHAYLPACLCLRGICASAIASDVRKGPLDRAASTIRRCHLEKQIECRLGSGLSTLSPKEADAIVIAGMGGELIAALLDADKEIAENAKQLILQPMTALPKLRHYLQETGFTTQFETLVREEEKLYHILEVKKTADTLPPLSDVEQEIGPYLLAHPPAEFVPYVKGRLKKLSVTIRGLSRSKAPDAKEQQKKYRLLMEAITRETGISYE